MMSTAEEVKAEMFGDNPSAGHHDGGGPLFARANRNGFSRRGITIAKGVNPGTILTCEIGGQQA